MGNLNYLNLGCGDKFHKNWVNVDMVSRSKYVIEANLLRGIPFKDNYFDVVYHSHVLEHFPKENAKYFIKECHRVLKPNGIIRVVLPNLENIVDEYKRLLTCNILYPNELTEANYDWIMLEMYDQTVRNYSGGGMARYLWQDKIINEEYVINRIGFIGQQTRNNFLSAKSKLETGLDRPNRLLRLVNRSISVARRKISRLFTNRISSSLEYKIGKFRLGGEIHMWMYDRYSLSRLLRDCGFAHIEIKNPYESDIPNWASYELDVKNNMIYDPTSLFVEARK
jgi:predicted SAM-dependent methyltransferase